MAIVVTEGSTFEPHPEGQFRAVCVDVVERHAVPTAFGPKNKVRIVWQTEENREDGKPFLASSSFNASLHEQSRLRPFLEAWRGRKFTAEELKGFDLDKLVGVNALIQITHTNKDGKTYDNVTAIFKPMRGMEALQSREYVRVQDRQPVGTVAEHKSFEDFPDALREDDDLPF
jgi:hypothetical protein